MTSDDQSENPVPPTAFGPALARHAWLLSGRVVAGVGQLLLWILTGLGVVLRPLGRRVSARLNGPRAQSPSGVPGPHPGGVQGPSGGGPTGASTTVTAPLPRWINGWREFTESWYFAPLTGFALTIAALAELAPGSRTPISITGGFAVASTLPLVWRREYLRPVAAVALGAFAASLLTGQEVLVTTVLAALYTLYALARQLPRQSAGVLAVGGVATVAVVYLATDTLGDVPWPAAVVAVLAATGLGDARRTVERAGRTEAAAEERNNETLTRLNAVQREQAVMRERARIARELHDVVAHSVSMIAVQAETAPYTMESLSPEAREGYTEIARTAREALVEMRRLLGVLRADAGAEAESAPQPRLDRLPELVDQHQGAGGRADLVVQGQPRALSTTVELSAYRIVQEALTNARRHAPGADVHIELTYLPDRLAVRVRDEGADGRTMILNPRDAAGGTTVLDLGAEASGPGNAPFGSGPAPTGPGNAPTGPGNVSSQAGNAPFGTGSMPSRAGNVPSGAGNVPSGAGHMPSGVGAVPSGPGYAPPGGGSVPSGGGHGLLGMKERATMLGGRFSAGHAADGGFVVEAELPLTREDPARDPGTSR